MFHHCAFENSGRTHLHDERIELVLFAQLALLHWNRPLGDM